MKSRLRVCIREQSTQNEVSSGKMRVILVFQGRRLFYNR